MLEKVNPAHPDKVADRIAGALVDIAYFRENDPRIAVEVLLGHGKCHIIAETSVSLPLQGVIHCVRRITGDKTVEVDYTEVPQDRHLAHNQEAGFRCGDNGIFRGVPVTEEQKQLTALAQGLYSVYQTDGKYVLDGNRTVICQSHATQKELQEYFPHAVINPLGDWTGGPNVDSGATNRKLGSDMGDSVTGGGIHGKDLSKADVSVNIYAWLKAQKTKKPVEISCAIGDETVDGRPYSEIVEIARQFIESKGGFEKFAEWGLIC